MKPTRHGNKRSRRRLRRYYAQRRKELAQMEADIARIRDEYDAIMRVDEMAYRIFLTVTGRV